jgi:hypothetical protein
VACKENKITRLAHNVDILSENCMLGRERIEVDQ